MGHKRPWMMVGLAIMLTLAVSCGTAVSDKADKTDNGTGRTAKQNVQFETLNVGGMSEDQIYEKLKSDKSFTETEPQNAKLDDATWEIAVKETMGKKPNINNTLEKILLSPEGGKVAPSVEETRPEVTSEQLLANIVEIGKYSTEILDRSPARVNNIVIAANKINYKKLQPGEEFSFNQTLGRRTKAKGYEQAPVIIRTEHGSKKGYGRGGGICQLSTTLYNAVTRGGLQVTERHMHSKKVGYVPKGKDATVVYGGVDFKFKNTRPYPVMIRTIVEKKMLTVRILENRNK